MAHERRVDRVGDQFAGAVHGLVRQVHLAAMQVARAHAAEYIGVDVTSEHKDVMSTDLGSDRVQDTVKGRATAPLKKNYRILKSGLFLRPR